MKKGPALFIIRAAAKFLRPNFNNEKNKNYTKKNAHQNQFKCELTQLT